MATATPAAPHRSSSEDRKRRAERRARAQEWKQFRREFLFTQNALADHLGCSRRTVTAIEAGDSEPHYELQRRFRDLKKQQEQQMEVA